MPKIYRKNQIKAVIRYNCVAEWQNQNKINTIKNPRALKTLYELKTPDYAHLSRANRVSVHPLFCIRSSQKSYSYTFSETRNDLFNTWQVITGNWSVSYRYNNTFRMELHQFIVFAPCSSVAFCLRFGVHRHSSSWSLAYCFLVHF